MIKKLKIKFDKKNKKIIKITIFLIICFCFTAYNISKKENSVYVSSASETMLIPSGQAVAMKLKTNGVMVVGTEANMPARKSGICVGDIITAANDVKILNTNHFEDIILKSGGENLTFSINRDGKEIKTDMKAEKNDAGQLVCGMWLRDSAAGIGTVSFYSADKTKFYALGHPINDMDTNLTYDIRKGALTLVDIKGAKIGEKNKPGELIGSMENYEIGNILYNNNSGIAGDLSSQGVVLEEPMEIIPKDKVSPGKACIMSTVSDKGVGKYEIEIVKILNGTDNKDFIIKVTDKTLISLTGGIVRGMSGSPIIRDGKIIGAVTHVFVNDPTRGYGIFIENMLAEAEKIE